MRNCICAEQARLFSFADTCGLLLLTSYATNLLAAAAQQSTLFAYVPEVRASEALSQFVVLLSGQYCCFLQGQSKLLLEFCKAM